MTSRYGFLNDYAQYLREKSMELSDAAVAKHFKAREPEEPVFFILWTPQSEKPPRVRFHSMAEAERVARSMAQQHGEAFYVMQVISRSERVPPIPPVNTVKIK